MAYPVTGVEGALTSWSGTFYSNLVSKMTAMQASLRVSSPPQNVTPLGAAYDSYIPSIGTWEGTISGRGFATPRLGNAGLIAFSGGGGGYALHVDSIAVRITAGVVPITGMASTGPTWERFRPTQSTWAATVRCKVDSATALVLPDLASATGTASLSTVTMTYGKTSDATLAGTAAIVSVSPTIQVGAASMVELALQGTGTLTPAGAGSILGSTAFGVPEWDQASGLPDTTQSPSLLVTMASGKTFTGCGFWKSIDLSWDVRSPVALSIGVQGTGVGAFA